MAILLFLFILSIDSLTNAYNCLIVPGQMAPVGYPVVPVTGPLYTQTYLIKPETREDSGDTSRRTCADSNIDRRSGNGPQPKKLLSSLLTLPGMVADKLISGEISI